MRCIININRFLAESCGYLLMLVMFLTASDVLLRNLGFAVFGIVEISMFIVIAAVYFGLGHCEEENGHVRLDMAMQLLPPVHRQAGRLLAACATFAVMGLAVYACARSAVNAFASNEAVMANQTPLYSWPARTAIAVGLFFYCCQLVLSIGKEWLQLQDVLAGNAGKERAEA